MSILNKKKFFIAKLKYHNFPSHTNFSWTTFSQTSHYTSGDSHRHRNVTLRHFGVSSKRCITWLRPHMRPPPWGVCARGIDSVMDGLPRPTPETPTSSAPRKKTAARNLFCSAVALSRGVWFLCLVTFRAIILATPIDEPLPIEGEFKSATLNESLGERFFFR